MIQKIFHKFGIKLTASQLTLVKLALWFVAVVLINLAVMTYVSGSHSHCTKVVTHPG